MGVAMRRTWWVVAGLAGLLGSAAFSADLPQPDVTAPMVHYQDGRLSARIDDVPLDDVLRAVTAETGVRFEGIPLDQRDVSKRFDDVPFAEALRRLIGRQNFTLVYGSNGQPSRVRLLDVPALPVARGARTPAPPSFRAVLAQQPPVAVSDHLAAALGAQHGPLPLVRVLQALRLDGADIRDEAVGVFLHALQTTPALRSSFLALDDRTVATLAWSWGGTHAADALSLLVTRARTAEVRGLATKGLARLKLDEAQRG
jgi:hypothetical protein